MRKNGRKRGLRAHTARACTAGAVALLVAGTGTACGVEDLIGGGTASPSPGGTAGAAPRTAKPSPRPPARGFPAAERLAKQAMAKSDGDAFTKLGCASARKSVAVFGELLDEPRPVLGLADTDPADAIAHRWKEISVTLGPSSGPESMGVIFENDFGQWCVTDVRATFPGGPAGIPLQSQRQGELTAVVQRYLTLINTGEVAEAASYHRPSSNETLAATERELREELKGVGPISVDRSVPVNRNGDIKLKTTQNGKPAEGTLYTSSGMNGMIVIGKLHVL